MKQSALVGAVGVVILVVPALHAQNVPEKYREPIAKGLEWLAGQQTVEGSWVGPNNQYPVPMTALAGQALELEGSTTRQGKYAKHLDKAVTYLVGQCKQDGQHAGLIGPGLGGENRYTFGHGFAMEFLAAASVTEENPKRRAELVAVLHKAVKFAADSQSTKGGWYYTSGKTDKHDLDEGATTLAMLAGLRAARNAGIAVPLETLTKAKKYLQDNTGPQGGLYYASNSKIERPALTPGAVALTMAPNDFKNEHVKKWLKYCRTAIPLKAGAVKTGYDEFAHYFYARAAYALGEDGWDQMFGPNDANRVTWRGYQEDVFPALVKLQQVNGSWLQGGLGVGPVYATAVYLNVLQRDRSVAPR